MEIVSLLYNIRSIHNVGSIFRTADAAGVSKIYLLGVTPAPFDKMGESRPQFAKVSLGAEKNVPYESVKSPKAIANLITKLKKDGYTIFALEQAKRSVPYYAPRVRAKKIALVVGNEVRGVSPTLLKQADMVMEIPMRGAVVRQAHHPRRTGRGKESLNVSVAFGIAVFHLRHGAGNRV